MVSFIMDTIFVIHYFKEQKEKDMELNPEFNECLMTKREGTFMPFVKFL